MTKPIVRDSVRICDLCGTRPASDGYREISGWEKLRAQGGANQIVARKETGQRACTNCIELMRRGLSLEQGDLWG